MDTDETYLTVPEAAKELHVSRQTVHRWVAAGKLRAVRVGGVLRVPRSALSQVAGEYKPGDQVRQPAPDTPPAPPEKRRP